jgi:hypothetical protein
MLAEQLIWTNFGIVRVRNDAVGMPVFSILRQRRFA